MMTMSKKKGITPVIAIVLLLLITVGAVGVVYDQFQSIQSENDPQSELNDQQKIQQASYDIVGAKQSGNNYVVIIKNTGDEVFDLANEATVTMGRDGGTNVALSAYENSDGCNWQNGDTDVQSGETVECHTGVEWQSDSNDDGQPTTFQLQIGSVTKATYNCKESSTDEFC